MDHFEFMLELEANERMSREAQASLATAGRDPAKLANVAAQTLLLHRDLVAILRRHLDPGAAS